MRAAGERLAAAAAALAPAGPLVAFAGPGNNGGDAFAALALLTGRPRTVYAMCAPRPSAARLDAEQCARTSGVEVRDFPADETAATAALEGAALALDGLLGTGARAE